MGSRALLQVVIGECTGLHNAVRLKPLKGVLAATATADRLCNKGYCNGCKLCEYAILGYSCAEAFTSKMEADFMIGINHNRQVQLR